MEYTDKVVKVAFSKVHRPEGGNGTRGEAESAIFSKYCMMKGKELIYVDQNKESIWLSE